MLGLTTLSLGRTYVPGCSPVAAMPAESRGSRTESIDND